MNEIVTPEMKAKVHELFEKDGQLIAEQSDFIEELMRRLDVAEKVCYAANMYVRGINSPLCVGWDLLIGALQKWTEEKARQIKEGEDGR